MKALVYRLSLPRVVLAKLLAHRWPWLVYGPAGAVVYTDWPDPVPPGEDWAVVAPRLAGLCGSDIGVIAAHTSPSASPFSSFPAVLGHEVVGVIAQGGARVPWPAGTRVVVDPSISCTMRGLPPCPQCQRGFPYLCQRCTDGTLSPGFLVGFCRDLPGGWAQRMLAHASQLHPVPDGMSDERAVLVEPLAIAVHGVLRRPPAAGARILVIGAGTIGLSTVAALRLLGYDAHVTVAARHGMQARLARELGASRVVSPADLGRAAAEAGARAFRPLIGRAVYRGGFDLVYDCVGTRRSLDDALRLAREGGTVVLLGAAGEIPKIDWTFVWMRELEVVGAVGYGLERVGGRTVHTFDLVLEALAAHPELPVERMVTHRFPLHRYREALQAALDRRASGAIKIVFTPNEGGAPTVSTPRDG
ncbi:alcohol dehydrogenase [Thermaerobacter sp. FW80]|uniref:zinc-dependent alcohol dehydrogenase n=1 Tax=Thermaerobacter sp. FW80 TaxID=2546351 RepID=UPI0010751BE7|nr:zinc-binding dehydrogenase [Thermaerobacter sp. FW80]QBS37546.1 alcohol dehydrogenase [Thermaerobacter sp. FW80]